MLIVLGNSVNTVMYKVEDKVVLVTGGAAGIGAGIIQAFLEEGARHVSALDIDENNGRELEKEMCSKHGKDKCKFRKCDVITNELESAYSAVIADFGYIDVVVNCAGIMNDKPNAYLKEIAINVSALVASSFKAYELMRIDHGGKGGTIINISSIVGLFQGPTLPVYSATKSAVLQFSNCLGMEPRYSMSGVRVITLCFGCTDTSLFDPNKMGTFDKEFEMHLKDGLATLPLQKLESAVTGLVHAYKNGASGSTWLVTSDRPAEDITANVTKAYQIMSQGVFS